MQKCRESYFFLCFHFVEEPLRIVKRLSDQDGLENTPITLECELNKPNAPFEWLFNDKPIAEVFEPDTYTISQQDNKYLLTIPKCNLKNQGMFTFNIPAANLKTKALVNVSGK